MMHTLWKTDCQFIKQSSYMIQEFLFEVHYPREIKTDSYKYIGTIIHKIQKVEIIQMSFNWNTVTKYSVSVQWAISQPQKGSSTDICYTRGELWKHAVLWNAVFWTWQGRCTHGLTVNCGCPFKICTRSRQSRSGIDGELTRSHSSWEWQAVMAAGEGGLLFPGMWPHRLPIFQWVTLLTGSTSWIQWIIETIWSWEGSVQRGLGEAGEWIGRWIWSNYIPVWNSQKPGKILKVLKYKKKENTMLSKRSHCHSIQMKYLP